MKLKTNNIDMFLLQIQTAGNYHNNLKLLSYVQITHLSGVNVKITLF